MLEGLFGSETAEKVILYLAYVGEGHIRGIATNFKAGRTRLFQLNPTLIVKKELIALADKAVSAMPPREREKYIQRLRPRKTDKKL